MARACIAAFVCCSGNQGPAFTDYEVNNFMDIMGEIMSIGPLDGQL